MSHLIASLFLLAFFKFSPSEAATCRDILMPHQADSSEQIDARVNAIREYLVSKGYDDGESFILLSQDAGIKVLNTKNSRELEQAVKDFQADQLPAAPMQTANAGVVEPSQMLPVLALQKRMRLADPSASTGHRFTDRSDQSTPLRNRVYVDYEFLKGIKLPVPNKIQALSISNETSSVTDMENEVQSGELLKVGQYVGFERNGGPIIVSSEFGFNGVGEDHHTVIAERVDTFDENGPSIFSERKMRFHFDQYIGSDFSLDKLMDLRRARKGVSKLSVQLKAPAKEKNHFQLNGFWTKAESSANDQVLLVGKPFSQPAKAYSSQLQNLGFQKDFIDQLPAGAQLVFMANTLLLEDGFLEGSLLLVIPFNWEKHFGFLALNELKDRAQPEEIRSPLRRGPRRRR